MQPVSFSVWRSEDAATRFEYRDGHIAAVSRVQRSQADLLKHYSVGRFDPYRSQGTWHGRNPLADASKGCRCDAALNEHRSSWPDPEPRSRSIRRPNVS
jgi:hypothetical protein